MSSLSTFVPLFRPNAARLATVAGFVAFLLGLGFLVPFWIVLIVAAGFVVIGQVVRAVRAASRKVDQIMAEELSSENTVR
ncbi:hypothetical protein JOF56_001881 [Kibdelosporangium banguiense]|uniref:DUF4229 domain-containing protein n=1 Tax=Kibdelosporangium banguiense TaxID=1365924 RepID=A0ABS4TAQ0_9PSEU|nr:hypothetical protein [Kibdelosporangium banguiense]MBP2321496.1 hypothetical protein [Kibdelosporangium banguiense]